MKVQLVFVALASCFALCYAQVQNQAEDALLKYLTELRAGDESVRKELVQILAPQNIDNVIECLLAGGQREGCDPRSTVVSRLIPLLMLSNLQCSSCTQPMQQTINDFASAIFNNPSACQKLMKGLQVDPNRFCKA